MELLISFVRLRAAEVAIFIYETDYLEQKVSLRSNGIVDVSKIAHSFGGGGHVKARRVMNGTVFDAINNLIPILRHSY